jgi:hypothetical protein
MANQKELLGFRAKLSVKEKFTGIAKEYGVSASDIMRILVHALFDHKPTRDWVKQEADKILEKRADDDAYFNSR